MSTEWDFDSIEFMPGDAGEFSGLSPHPLASLFPHRSLPEPVSRPGAAILVVGGCGGAGATTTALGIASAVAMGGGGDVVAVDATASGGDLGVRGADEWLRPVSLQSWLADADRDDAASDWEVLSWSSSGAGILWRDDTPMPQRRTVADVAQALSLSGWLAVYDGGAPVSARHLLPLVCDGRTALVLVIPARADAVNRMRASLHWLDDNLGGDVVADTTLVVSHQTLSTQPIAEQLREHLDGSIRDVLNVPYDPHLGTGLGINPHDLAPATAAAYTALAEGTQP